MIEWSFRKLSLQVRDSSKNMRVSISGERLSVEHDNDQRFRSLILTFYPLCARQQEISFLLRFLLNTQQRLSRAWKAMAVDSIDCAESGVERHAVSSLLYHRSNAGDSAVVEIKGNISSFDSLSPSDHHPMHSFYFQSREHQRVVMLVYVHECVRTASSSFFSALSPLLSLSLSLSLSFGFFSILFFSLSVSLSFSHNRWLDDRRRQPIARIT